MIGGGAVGRFCTEPTACSALLSSKKQVVEEEESYLILMASSITFLYQKMPHTYSVAAKLKSNISYHLKEQTLKSKNMSSNVALKATIDEWKERNEAARIKVAREALSLAGADNMVLEAIDDLRSICNSRPYNKVQVRNIGMIPLLAKFLEYRSRSIRYAILEKLRQLTEEDKEGKDATIIKMLSSNHAPVRHASTSLLLELSKCKSCCYKIGTVAGGILMLITVKYRSIPDLIS